MVLLRLRGLYRLRLQFRAASLQDDAGLQGAEAGAGGEAYDADAPFAGSVEVQSVRIPLKMHVGGPCTPTVSAGEKVEKGQLIARPEGLGANIHASIAGTVTAVTAQMIEIRR